MVSVFVTIFMSRKLSIMRNKRVKKVCNYNEIN